MSNIISEKLAQVKDLINEFRLEEALQLVEEIERKENLTPEDLLKNLVFKSRIYYYIGQRDISFEVAEELYQKSQELRLPLFSLDALYLKEAFFYYPQPNEDFYKTLEQHETLFNSIPREESLEFQEREAILLVRKGMREFNRGDLDLALDYYNKSLKIFKQDDPHSFHISFTYALMVYIFELKGELNLALEYSEKALSLLPEREYFFLILTKLLILGNLGFTYFHKGELDLALEYLIRDLEMCKEIKYPLRPYFLIIPVLLAKNDLVQASYYLKEYEQWVSNNLQSESLIYQAARGLVLKKSPRLRDHFEAAAILKKVNEKFHHDPLNTYSLYYSNIIKVGLSDLYLEEFRLSNRMEVLDDIPPLIEQLQKNATLQNSFSLLANVKLLQAKLSIIQINLVEARKLLTEAQKIADEHGIQRLAGEISREHDHLLEQLKLWESIQKEQASVEERLKLASIDAVMERLQGKRALEPLEEVNEDPILLLIMDQSGATYFNHSFGSDLDIEGIFGSFMSAFNTFSSELFSKSIDRVKIGENTILINPIESFLVCYVIKGQSYPAQQKLSRFSDIIKYNTEIQEALNKAVKTSEMLEIDNFPSLKTIMNDIFINR